MNLKVLVKENVEEDIEREWIVVDLVDQVEDGWWVVDGVWTHAGSKEMS